jgi:ATP-dependent DNA helicase RecG
MAGLVERAGQGMDTIFGNTIREGKGVPNFTGSDNDWVNLHIPAKVKDEQFILFLEKVTNDNQITLSFEEICELENIREHQKVTDVTSKEKFLSLGIIEKVGRTRGAKYILSHKWYQYKERPGLYTKIVGLSREKNKELILAHLVKNPEGARSSDFQDALGLDQKMVNNMLQELKQENKVRFEGARASGKWFTASS